ncbi:SusC/RagA family TonB-linked outer membrane protein [Cellulophaga lytica]|uniref:SusC/RagA family TonB-linked outer membrane protein n=1 Tax=Cellulophaga lytica TaxID=979 RepID=UPI001E597704|nr:SusC/RagA family TonB-linked outer membrane protein [Cellulophaga lytica]
MKIKLMNVLFCYRRKLMMKIMKAIIFLWCTAIFSFTTTNSFSQNAKISIKEDAVVSVDMVFDIIMEQTDYKFIYSEGFFDAYPKVVLHKGIIKANALLDKTLENSDVSYEFLPNKTIVIVKKPGNSSINQQLQITGKVLDENTLPLLGVTILVEGTTNGVTTDFDGNYLIKAKAGDVLSFSYVGYLTQKIKVKENESVINVVLKENVNVLDEVTVISTGYQQISEERSTGAFETIKKSQLEKPASSISERLVGMVAGLQSTINSDGSIDFQIRGQSSLFADQQPLIVLDGFPIEGGFETINPNDVESITVLKDAAAASIWGAKSANGVIVVTTKKAKQGKTNISVSTFVKVSDKLDLDYSIASASASDVLAYEQSAFDTNFFGSLFGGPQGASPFNLNSYSLGLTAMNEARLGRITASERDARLATLSGLNNKKQIEKYLLQSPITSQYNISVSGGSDTMKNNLSLLYEDNKTFFKGDEQSKYLINYTSKIKVNDRLDFDFAGMMQYRDIRNNSGEQNLYGEGDMLSTIRSLAPWDMLVNEDGSRTDLSYLKYYTPNLNAFVPTDAFPYSDWSYNPITDVENRDFSTKSLNSRIQAGLNFKIMDGLSISSKIQYEIFKTNEENYYNEKTFDVRQFVNETSGWNRDFNTVPTQNIPSGGILKKSDATINSYNFRNQLNFNRTFADRHTINFIAGTELSNRVYKSTVHPDSFGYSDETLASSELLNPVQSATMWNGYPLRFASFFYPFNLTPTSTYQENTNRFFSLFGNLGYTFNNKYTITGSYRTDASNLITDDPSFRYNPFWSVGGSWKAHKEGFLNDVEWLNRLNLRATYGFNGNVDRSTSFKPLIALGSSLNVFTQENTATISSFGNPTLRWEKTKTLNFGVDFSLFKSRLNGSVDVYNKQSFDLIVSQSIASVNGTTNQKFNNGEMYNRGIEVTLGTTLPISGNDVVWTGSVNYAYNNNKVTNFFKTNYQAPELYSGPTTSYVEGYNANTLWSYQYSGLTNVGTDANPVLKPSVVGEGGTPITLISWPQGNAIEYMESQGTLVAPTTVGMRNSFKIYDFDLSFIVTGKFGHVFRRQGFNYNSLASGGNTQVNEKYSEVANGDPNQILPIPTEEGRYYFYDRFHPYMDYLTEDASHIRFQEISLSYSLPSKVVSDLGINALRFYAQANNVGTILFNDFGEDPEYPKGGLRLQSSLTFGMNLNF